MNQAGSFEHPRWMNVVYTDQFLQFLSAKGFQCKTLLDVGAHKGYWTRDFKAVFRDTSVLLIEPLEEMRPILEKFCLQNSDCEFIIAGAGPDSGEMEFTIWPSLSGSSFVPQRGHAFYDTHEKRKVPVVTIDSLVASGRLPIPEVAKLDVQGFELEVLKGAASILGKTEVFFLEVSFFKPLGPGMPVFFEVVKYMHDRGYVAFDITGFYRRRKDHALAQCDMVFVLESSPLRNHTALTREFDWDYAKFAK